MTQDMRQLVAIMYGKLWDMSERLWGFARHDKHLTPSSMAQLRTICQVAYMGYVRVVPCTFRAKSLNPRTPEHWHLLGSGKLARTARLYAMIRVVRFYS